MMKRLILLSLPTSLALLFLNCPWRETDEDKIRDLLNASQYSAEGSETVTDEDDTLRTVEKIPGLISMMPPKIPFVRFGRRIKRPITRHIEVDVTGDSAHAVITTQLDGAFFTTTSTGAVLTVYKREFADSGYREVWLTRDVNAPHGWRITHITPCDIYTIDAECPITIQEVKAEVVSRGYTFTLIDPKAPIAKQSLPTFEPFDTVKVTTTISIDGDSCWAFLHHGCRHRRIGRIIHRRDPFYYESGTYTFTREWHISSDSAWTPGHPAVRHTAVDVIGWQTLFDQDSTAKYYTHAWTLPYIIRKPEEPVPPDTIAE